ncbi:MAG: hypothetical protein EOO60_13640 [Hymenobacter sp.]|nr:MAG: hypothetical protein EOO60_13640 [Hymenobacter sp.]
MQPKATRHRAAAAAPAEVAGLMIVPVPVLPTIEFHAPNGMLIIKDAREFAQVLEHYQAAKLAAEAEQTALSTIYRLSGEPDESRPHGGLLTRRLDISERTARALITEGRLKYSCLGLKGYRVSELAVRQLLGDT